MKSRLLLFVPLLLIIFASASFCAIPVKVCVYNFNPLVFEKDGTADGFFIDILKYVAEEEDWSLEYAFGSWAACLQKLDSGAVDLLPSIVRTTERAEKFDFTKEYLFLDWGVLYQRHEGGIDTFLDLNGKKIAVLKDSIFTTEFAKLLDSFGIYYQFVEKHEYSDVLKAVESGEVDAGACTNVNGTVLEYLYDVEKTHLVFAPEIDRFAVKKGQSSFVVEALDKYIAELKRDKSSIYYTKFDEWMDIGGSSAFIPLWAKWLSGAVLFALFIALLFVAELRRAVKRRTRSLEKALKELSESESRFRSFVESAPDCIFVQSGGRLVYVNPAMMDLVGASSSEELIGKDVFELVAPDYIEIVRERILEQKKTGKPAKPMEQVYLRMDGSRVDVETTAVPVKFSGDDAHLVFSRDFTERNQAANAAKAAREYAENIIETANTMVVGIDNEGKITTFNRAAEKITGYTKKDLEGLNWFEVIVPLDRYPKVWSEFHRLMDGGMPAHFENPILTKSGEERYIVWSNSHVVENGKVVGTISFGLDITDSKMAERKIIESEAKYRRLVENLGKEYFVYTHNKDGVFTYLSPSVSDMLGYTQEEFFTHYTEYLTDNPINMDVERHTELSIQGVQQPPYEIEIFHRDGRRIWLEVAETPIKDKSGNVDAVEGIARDITDRKQAEEKLQESEARVRRKLESILLPDGNIEELDLADLLDMPAIQSMLDDFLSLTNIGTAILDDKGKVLEAAGWKDICTKFHRVHPIANENCLESDTILSGDIEPGTFKMYQCKNNLWDVATPIDIGGKLFGRLYMGQFLLDSDQFDPRVFRDQSKLYGFDEAEYMAAVEQVPTMSMDIIETAMSFFIKFSKMISTLSYANVKLARIVVERDNLYKSLHESEEKYRRLMMDAPIGIVMTSFDGRILECNDTLLEISHISESEMVEMYLENIFIDEAAWKHFSSRLQREGRFHGFKTILKRTDGSVYDSTINASLLSIGGRGVILSVIQDVTELKRQEEFLKESEEKMRGLSQKLITAQEEERGRISRDIHDQVGRIVTSLSLEVGWLKKVLPESETIIAPLQEMINNASGDVRRLCMGLRPVVLDRMGLSLALRELIGEFEEQSGLEIFEEICEIDMGKVSAHAAISMYRILQESINNIIKHSKASKVNITLKDEDNHLVLNIKDNGIGISRDKNVGIRGFGLAGMKERAAICDGSLEIFSNPGEGVCVRLTVPINV